MDKKTIDTTVYKLSGHPTLTGYKQLATAVQYCLEDGAFPARNLTVTLYPRIAASLCQTPRSVARSISRAVDDCWEYGDRKVLEGIAGRRIREKPTPGEMIFFLYRYLSR